MPKLTKTENSLDKTNQSWENFNLAKTESWEDSILPKLTKTKDSSNKTNQSWEKFNFAKIDFLIKFSLAKTDKN